MWVLRLYFHFEASKKSESIVNPHGVCLTERAQWAFERPGRCGVRPSIWQHLERLGGEVRAADCLRARYSSSSEISKN
jgi:hypothetical protein